jgi:hypothetical protein
VVLDVSEIKTNIHPWGDFIIGIASFGEPAKDICFTTQEFHQAHNVLPDHADPTQKTVHIIIAGNEDFIFDDISFLFDSCDNWCKTVNNVIACI